MLYIYNIYYILYYIYILKGETVFHSGQVWIPHQIHISNSEGPESEAHKRTHQYKTLFLESLSAAVIQLQLFNVKICLTLCKYDYVQKHS